MKKFGAKPNSRYACLRYFNTAGTALGRGEDHGLKTNLGPFVPQTEEGRRDPITVFGNDVPTTIETEWNGHKKISTAMPTLTFENAFK
jgi:UDP-glucose 4-epimerase